MNFPSIGTTAATETTLARTLSHPQMTMIALGSALGTGLFLGSGSAIAIAGPGVIIAYAVGSLIAAIMVGCMGEMASRYPVRGGFGTMASAFLGSFWGYIARWSYWVVTVFVAANELVAVATYLQFWFPGLPLWLGIAVFAAALLAINLFSVHSFGSLEFVLSSIKVIALLVFVLVAAALVVTGLPGHPATGLTHLTGDGGFLPHGMYGVWTSMAVVMFSFGGIELVSVTAAEAADPARSVKAAARSTTIRLAFFYVLAILLILCITPWREAMNSGELTTSPFVQVFSTLGLHGAAGLTNVVVLIAALSAANANIYAGGRLVHALAGDRMAPRSIARVNRRGVPVRALLVSSVGIVLAVVLAATGVGALFQKLLFIIMFSVLTVWILVSVSYLAYRRHRHDGPPVFRLWGGPATALVGLVLVVIVFATAFVVPDMAMATLYGGCFLLALTIAWFAGVRRRAASVDLASELETVPR